MGHFEARLLLWICGDTFWKVAFLLAGYITEVGWLRAQAATWPLGGGGRRDISRRRPLKMGMREWWPFPVVSGNCDSRW